MYKETFRTLSKRLLNHIPIVEKNASVEVIKSRLIQTKWWENSNIIAMTISRKNELNTMPLIEQAWKQGKTVAIPKCYPKENHSMVFYHFTNTNELENVYLDLYEPKEDQHKVISKNDIDLIIVPGLLFDHQGYRIGYGGGYYDRYLNGFKNVKISIAMEEQIVKKIPHDRYDIPVDAVISESHIYY